MPVSLITYVSTDSSEKQFGQLCALWLALCAVSGLSVDLQSPISSSLCPRAGFHLRQVNK